MIYVLYTIHIVVCLFLIMVVLLQQGKGADLSVFGGGSTQTVFGARGAATLLHKMTVGGFIAFILTTISIGFLQSGGRQRSVFSDTAVEETAAPAEDAAATPEEGAAGEAAQEEPAVEAPAPPADSTDAAGTEATPVEEPPSGGGS